MYSRLISSYSSQRESACIYLPSHYSSRLSSDTFSYLAMKQPHYKQSTSSPMSSPFQLISLLHYPLRALF